MVSLLPSQEAHYAKLVDILGRYPFALDLSSLGAGKTYTSTHYALQSGIRHVVVICPVSVQPKWRMMKDTFGLPLKSILSYQSLRSQKHKVPSHGLLSRRDYQLTIQRAYGGTETQDKVEFHTTEKYDQWVSEGLLLIVDEIQNIKNVSGQFLAVQELIRPIVEAAETIEIDTDSVSPQKSRVILLSGSPMDKHEHATHLFRALHIMKASALTTMNLQTYQNQWSGLREIYDFCMSLDSAETGRVHQPYSFNNWHATQKYVYDLFQKVFKKHVSSFMLPPPVPTLLHKRNAFYILKPEERAIIVRGVSLLKDSLGWSESNATVQFGTMPTATFQGVTRALQIIETGKIGLFRRVALEALSLWPRTKVVIAVNYTETIRDLVASFVEFGVETMTGALSEERRGRVLQVFQAPTDECRVLIGNQSVLSTGIDLDDKDGSWPRMCLVSPNYSTITAYQMGHRFRRADTRSDAVVHFVYGKTDARPYTTSPETVELQVLNAISRKSAIMKETTPEQAETVVFPCDHEVFEES